VEVELKYSGSRVEVGCKYSERQQGVKRDVQ